MLDSFVGSIIEEDLTNEQFNKDLIQYLPEEMKNENLIEPAKQ